MKILQIQSFQDHHTFPNQKLTKFSPFKTTTTSQWENHPKLVLSRPAHPPTSSPPKVKITQNHSRLAHSLKLKIIQNQSFQDDHTFPKWTITKSPFKTSTPFLKWKISKISHFKTTIISQTENVQKSVFEAHHTTPNWTLSKINPFKTTTASKNVNYQKSFISKLTHLPKVSFLRSIFRDDHTPLKWELSKSIPFKMTTLSQH